MIDEIDIISPPTLPIEVILPEEEILEVIEQEVSIEILQPPAIYLDFVFDPTVEEIEIITGLPVGGDGGGGGTIAATLNLLRGDNTGNAVDSGITPSNVVVKHLTFPTPTTLNTVITCLQNAGLCA